MPKHTWLPTKPKSPPKPQVPDEVRAAIDQQAARVVADLKKQISKRPKNRSFNWPVDVFARWHRAALYFVVVMQTPHGRPPTFETHLARMEHTGNGRFDLAVPMRRGWNTFKRGATPDQCLKEIGRMVVY